MDTKELEDSYELTVGDAKKAVCKISKELKTGLKKLRTNQSFQYPELSQVTPSEIVVGGSLGHETTVPGKFDVDMVILSRDLKMNDFLPKDGDTKAKKVLLELKKYIEKHLGVQPEMKSHRTIFFTKQVGVPKPVEIDLLISPYFENPDEMYLCLSDYRQCNSVEWDYFYRTLLSPSATKWQKDFISKHVKPGKVKDLVISFKKWKKIAYEDGLGEPASYLLEVILIEACREYCKENKISDPHEVHMSPTEKRKFAEDIQERVTAFIIHHNTLSHITENEWYCQVKPGEKGRYKKCDFDHEQPYILDPSNPYNNLYYSGIKPINGSSSKAWNLLAEKMTSPELKPDLTKSPFSD